MCESTAYLVKGKKRELLMKDVVKAFVEGESVTLTNIIGERTKVAGKLAEVNLIGHSLSIVES